MKCSTCAETRARIQKTIRETSEPVHRNMLQIWLDHWWGEVVYDIDAVMATVSPDISYRWYGTNVLGTGLAIDRAEDAKKMYQSLFDAGLMPGTPIDEERVAFGSWGLSFDGLLTMVLPGSQLSIPSLSLMPDQLYLFQLRMAVFHPFDLVNMKMRGEIIYASAPQNIEPTDRAMIAHLLGHG